MQAPHKTSIKKRHQKTSQSSSNTSKTSSHHPHPPKKIKIQSSSQKPPPVLQWMVATLQLPGSTHLCRAGRVFPSGYLCPGEPPPAPGWQGFAYQWWGYTCPPQPNVAGLHKRGTANTNNSCDVYENEKQKQKTSL